MVGSKCNSIFLNQILKFFPRQFSKLVITLFGTFQQLQENIRHLIKSATSDIFEISVQFF